MLPKKGRKSITINKILYHYNISGCINVIVQNSETGEKFTWHEEMKYKWKFQMTPSKIKDIIVNHNNKTNGL